MHILSLQSENVKRIQVVRINPEGALVEITGENGQGKTSVLDSLWWALEGADIQARPIRTGADRGAIRVTLGRDQKVDYIVERTFTRRSDAPAGEKGYTTKVTVTTPEGARFDKPQTILSTLFGALSFDPLDFTKLDPRKQFDTLKAFVPGVDFDATERLNKADYDTRTEVGRRLKDAVAAAGAVRVPDDAPEQGVDEEPLLERLQNAADTNGEIERERANRTRIRALIEAGREKVAADQRRVNELRNEARYLEQQAEKDDAQIDEDEAQVNALPPLDELIDTAEARATVDAARATNRAFALRQERDAHQGRATLLEGKRDALTKAIDERKAAMAAAIAKAEMPVDGLGFGEGVLLFNGEPFDQASDAQQLQVSVAVAAKLNPRLRVIRVRDGSLLGAKSMAALATYAEQHDLQVWVETVESGRPGAVVLEEGWVKGEEGVEPELTAEKPAAKSRGKRTIADVDAHEISHVDQAADQEAEGMLDLGAPPAAAPAPRRRPSDMR